MLKRLKSFLRDALTRKKVVGSGVGRKVRLNEEAPSDRFVIVIILMIVFFVGLVGLEVAHMVWLGSWNDVVFNGIMLVVGSIVGVVWGKTQ